MLADGAYEALVLDVSNSAGDTAPGAVDVELTIVAGEHKGAVVTVRAAGLAHDPLELLGVPATLTVEHGEPRVRFEP